MRRAGLPTRRGLRIWLVVVGRERLVSFGVRAADMRVRSGCRRARLPVSIPSLPRPQGVGPLVLGGGGEDVAHLVVQRLGLHRPVVAYLGAADPHSPGPGLLGSSWERAAATVIDAGLYRRADAFDDAVCQAIRSADVVLLGCGELGALASTLAGSPALDELIAASDRGAVVVGSSSSAMELGAVVVDPNADDGPMPVPALGRLPDLVVIPHHRDTDEELQNLRRWVWPAAHGRPLLLLPHTGTVLVHPGWAALEVIDPGEHEIGAWWWRTPDRQPEPALP